MYTLAPQNNDNVYLFLAFSSYRVHTVISSFNVYDRGVYVFLVN